ncbi:hypothetical protein O0I10_011469 [Lichtheimia ornata]|uniref:Kinetochore protein Spc24 n=1 Tax=Lichtheimia ornata TaxID=688661 RepID=A0AAD7USP9_9FUNG|nr:uncharacterized protein O0I10_011469 [Lichtheimia ornata]KAJ8652869.1 hypothetical protein O0I10_011469 [Lichtheimia ornata]
MSSITDSTDPMPAIQQAQKALESLQIKDTVDKINDSYQQLQTKIETQREEEQRIEQELQQELDMLKQQLEEVSKTHDLEALDREREKLEEETRAVIERRQAMEVEVDQLKQELHALEAKELDNMSKDFYSLLMVIYRGLGVKTLPEEDGSFKKLQLTSPDNQKVQVFDVSKGYTPYYIAKKIWQYITPPQ